MSRSTIKNNRGEIFPKIYKGFDKRRSKFRRKFFGYRKGDGSVPNAVKNEDYINYGYPMEIRHKSEVEKKINDDINKEMLKETSL
jgi:hypothetical protein